MARKFLVPIDLSKQELQNAVIQNLATAPSSPVEGQIYYDTDTNIVFFWNGTSWVSTETEPYTYGSGASTTLGISDSAADGSSTALARADHKHAGPGFGNVTAQTSYGASSGNGSATTVARSDHSHGTPAHGASEHSGIKISDLAAPTSSVSFNSQKITNLATPTSASDAATKEYVDAVAEGLHIHASVHAATTGTLASITGGSVTYSNGTGGINATLTLGVALTTLDVYSLQDGDRILVKNEATQAHNGIYTWATGGTVLTRAGDFNTAVEIAGGDFVFVTEGTTYNNTGWVQTEAVTTVGSDSVIFQQFSGAGTYTASNGVLLTGSNFTFSPKTDGGLNTGSSGAFVKLPTNSGLGTTSDGLAVGAGTGITVSGGTVALTNTSVTVNGTAISLGSSGTVTANTTNALTAGTGLALNSGTTFDGSSAKTVSIDTSVVARKYSTALTGSSTSYTVTHNLGTRDVMVSVRETGSPYAKVEPDIAMATTNTVTISFATAPTSDQYTVTVIG